MKMKLLATAVLLGLGSHAHATNSCVQGAPGDWTCTESTNDVVLYGDVYLGYE